MREFLLKYVWLFPQMLAAYIHYLVRKKYIQSILKGNFYTVYIGANRGGMTLGDSIFMSKNYHGEYLDLVIAHESGHVKQSLYLGPLYLLVIGIPSILWAWSHRWIAPRKSYYSFYTEKWANNLGGVTVNEDGVLVWKYLVDNKYGYLYGKNT